MKHIIGVIVFIAVLTALAWAWLGKGFDQLFPARASEEAFYVDRLFGIQLYVILFLFALIIGFMLYSIIFFRQKAGDSGYGKFFHGNSTLEILWTIVPLGIVLYIGALGAQYLNKLTASEPNELYVRVIGSQWNWRFDYPDYGISSSELFLPQNRQTNFEITSIDVIHSFWVPEFRLKQDAVPGQMFSLRLTPTETGSYTVRCAEICGTDHAYMLASVTVMTPDDFDQWLNTQTEPREGPQDLESDIQRGEEVARLNGCFKCHTVDGSEGDGPTWLGLYMSDAILTDGTTVVVDDEYLRRSILDPRADIVAGFEDVDMPLNFAAALSDEDLDAVVDFIESLSSRQ